MASTTLVYGVSGARKTTAMGEAAEYLYERSGGKPGRAIYTDGGGWQVIRGLVEAGIVQPYNIIDEPDLPVVLHALARGYWPDKLDSRGIREPGSQLKRPRPETWHNVGFYIFEGLTSSSELLMKYLRERQIAIGGDAIGKFSVKSSVTEGGEGKDALFCANNLKHYDWVQGEMLAVLAEFSGLPVERVLLTAHEAPGTDDDTRDPIRGPALVGKAGTAKIGKNVGDCIHFELYTRPSPEKALIETAVRGYYQSHPDPKFANIMYNCKSRIPAAQAPELLKQFPGGWFDPKDFGKFLAISDKLISEASAAAMGRKAAIDARIKKA